MKKNKSSFEIPSHLNTLIEKAKIILSPNCIKLFGSRARLDHHPKSDFDISFEFSDQNNKLWAVFTNEISENSPSLYKYDLVDYKNADEALKRSIDKEGIVIYEKK